jgi:hypothetical protein
MPWSLCTPGRNSFLVILVGIKITVLLKMQIYSQVNGSLVKQELKTGMWLIVSLFNDVALVTYFCMKWEEGKEFKLVIIYN